MDVNGIGAVMEIPGCAVILLKEVVLVEVETSSNARFELVRLQVSVNLLQCAKVVTGVKVVNPSLLRTVAVGPRAVRLLVRGGAAGYLECGTHESAVAGQPRHAAEQRRAQEIGVVDVRALGSQRSPRLPV